MDAIAAFLRNFRPKSRATRLPRFLKVFWGKPAAERRLVYRLLQQNAAKSGHFRR
jgi:hypothetical protein